MNVRLLLKLSLYLIPFCASSSIFAVNANPSALNQYDYASEIFHPIHAKHGMVASEETLATQVGLDILKRGGNAIDAAVGVGFALAVVLPNAGNIGGGGFMVVHDAKSGKNFTLDFREMAPQHATRNMYLDDKGNIIPNQSLYTHKAVGVPGTVAGMEYALKKWGTLPLSEVIKPSIELAHKGIAVTPELAELLKVEQKDLEKWDSTKAIFFKGDVPLQEGDLLVQKDLAKSLRLIAKHGSQAFYNGEIGKKIVAEMQSHGGILTADDLRDYKAIERAPIVGDYRGYKIVTMPPPSSGGVHIVQILNMLEHYPMSNYGVNSAQSIHHMAEAMKLAYADRSEYLGDPDFTHVPVTGLISKKYAAELVKKILPDSVIPSSQIKPNNPIPYESDQTTHYSTVDQYGNAVAVTYTLNFNFGSGIVAEGTGILLNDEMDDFSSKPGVPNGFGLVGGEANAIGAKKRPLSSMSPTIVLKDNKPWLVTGSPGGSRIINVVLQTIIDSIDFNMNPAEAASTPRIHHQWLPDELRVEKGISPDTIELLKKQGYTITQKAIMGRTQTIQILPDGFYGYSDPRNPEGATKGY